MDQNTINYYETNAEQLVTRYRGADASALHALLRLWLPSSGQVLEIGCGCGRDAAFMASLGLEVTATDASPEMLDRARTEAPAGVRLLQAAFPLPTGHPLLRERFEAVVAVAVLMHVPEAELFDFAFQIRTMLKSGGRFVCSFCSGREPTAEDPRLYVNREPGEVRLLFERLGFEFLTSEENEDGLGRGVRWTTLVFGAGEEPGTRPVDRIETIVNRDRKDATYKLALLRALCDIAQTASRHVAWQAGGKVSVPLGLIAEKWLYYYWPLVDAEGGPLKQRRGSSPIAFQNALQALTDHFRGQSGLSGFHVGFQACKLDPEAQRLTDMALNRIAETIVVGPVHFASQGGFGFDGKRRSAGKCGSPKGLYESLGRVSFDAGVWREMCLVGHWISEAIVLRWAELTVEICGKSVRVEDVLGRLLERPETDRDVHAARAVFKNRQGVRCVWTDIELEGTRFDMDHVIPFSLWRNNDLWNLLPADPKINNLKGDRLVAREWLLHRKCEVIGCWQVYRAEMRERFDMELNRTLFGHNFAETQWEAPAFSALTEAVETLALQRGIERWQPVRLGGG